MKYEKIIKQMSLEDKVALCSGADNWNTKRFERYGIPSVMMSDGPHGLRKKESGSDADGINKSKPATCFPSACATGSSWDRELLKEIGDAIAEEALYEGISVVLGPGINIKRNPLCGRNFEYFSEDPVLAGELGTAFIQGIQERGVGTSLKHFAANSQESMRFTSDSIVDERTLREIYLSGFETAVKKGKPTTVMCAYNKLNGVYCSDNKYLLQSILRHEWGFDGIVVSDWGAVNDRVAAFEAGTDLEMPGGADYFDSEVINAVKAGLLSEERIDESVDRLLTLIFKAHEQKKANHDYNADEHHQLARKAASSSAVLLKNDGSLLPLQQSQKIAVIGYLAEEIRYQGSGSSHITPTRITNVLEAFESRKAGYSYYKGYKSDGTTTDDLLNEAVKGARDSDVAIIFAGLTDSYESEGFDRESLSMPEGHNRLIKEVAKANPNTVVILMAGSVVLMPWIQDVRAILHMYLPGQAGGEAAADLLFGDVNPSGKLPETYPYSYEDVPSAGFYEKGGKQAQYREGIFVGYRYYDKAGVPVCFPFGFGLSYTTFEYSDLEIKQNGYDTDVFLSLKNTGKMAGAEVVQLYVSDLQQGIPRPEKELKGFGKVFLSPGETKRVRFTLDRRAFAYCDANSKDWQVQKGRYNIQLAASSRDIRLNQIIELEGSVEPAMPEELKGTWYEHLQGKPEQKDFEALLGRSIDQAEKVKKGNYTMYNSIKDMQDSFVMRIMYKYIERRTGRIYGSIDYSNPAFKMEMSSASEAPMKNLCIFSDGALTRSVAEGLVHMANGHCLKGLKTMLLGRNERS